MKIVIAPDSFKDSLSAEGVAQAIAEGLAQVWPDAELVQCPMADGGEGTVDAVLAACNGQLRRQAVRGPLGATVEARWGWLADSHTAIIEMAEASGLQLVAPGQRDACTSSTYGTGELIRAALDLGAERIILAIGGSAMLSINDVSIKFLSGDYPLHQAMVLRSLTALPLLLLLVHRDGGLGTLITPGTRAMIWRQLRHR